MAKLVRCASCACHVRIADRQCPFCGAGMRNLASKARGSFSTRLPLPGVLLAGSLALGAAAGCGDDGTTPTTDSGTETDAGNTDAGADAGPADAGPVDAGPADAGEDSPVVAAYGIPPDAG